MQKSVGSEVQAAAVSAGCQDAPFHPALSAYVLELAMLEALFDVSP